MQGRQSSRIFKRCAKVTRRGKERRRKASLKTRSPHPRGPRDSFPDDSSPTRTLTFVRLGSGMDERQDRGEPSRGHTDGVPPRHQGQEGHTLNEGSIRRSFKRSSDIAVVPPNIVANNNPRQTNNSSQVTFYIQDQYMSLRECCH